MSTVATNAQRSVHDFVVQQIHDLQAAKGLPASAVQRDSVLLGEALGIDSLDLATLVVALEEHTGLQPFASGFVLFKTVGELVDLFTAS